jgi:uncharacterized protein YggE
MRVFRLALLAASAAALTVPAAAQTPPAVIGDHYVPAPWWMRDPVIASIGYVRVELPANRASFTASYQVIDRSAAEATVQAADKVRALGEALKALGADKVNIETTFSTRPLYEQYRDKDGNLQENERPDKIEKYAVEAEVSVEVRDVAVLEQAYAQILAAKPTSTGAVSFSLDPTNETKAALYGEAIKDAAHRARASAEDAGARLGAVHLIDPTARACRTDVLAGWPSYAGGAIQPTTVPAERVDAQAQGYALAAPAPPPPSTVQEAIVTGSRKRGDAIRAEDMQLPLQAPRSVLEAQACVVYGLSG